MTTITIIEGKSLSRTEFKDFDDLIDEYYASKGMVILHQLDEDKLPPASLKLIDASEKKGEKGLIDFQG